MMAQTSRRRPKQERIQRYEIKKVLDAALEARLEASPIASKYHVGAAALWKDGILTRGWNIEYGGPGFGDAGMRCVHAEQHMVANAMKETRRDSIAYLAVVGGNSDDPQAPCGDCREIIKTYSDEDTCIIIREGGQDKLYTIEDLLPTRGFRHVRIAALLPADQEAITQSFPKSGVPGFVCLSRQMSDALSEDLDLAFCVARVAGKSVKGYQMDDPAFHQISAIGSALSQAWSYDEPIQSLHVFSTLGRIDGRDRQFIYNYASRHGVEKTLPVYICKIGARKPRRVMRATPAELLPFAFGVSYIERDDEDYRRKR